MNKLASKKKYQSLFVSLLLHAILFFCFYYALKKRDDLFTKSDPFKQPVPARVSFQPAPARSLVTQPPAKVQPQQKVVPQTQLPKQAEDRQSVHAASSADTALREERTDSIAQSGFGADQAGGPGGRPQSKITGAAFGRALSQAMHAEQVSQQERRDSRGQGGPAHVQERLEEWFEYHYKERIVKAINKAGRLYFKYMHLDQPVEKKLVLEVPVQRNGTLGQMPASITGIEVVDSHIKGILKTTDFPPIPQRFNKDEYIFRTNLTISLKRGDNHYNVRAN